MSAYGTKKPFGDAAVQLTFPLNFQRAYDMPFQYYQDEYEPPMDILVGTDFQSHYHEEKRQYANKTVLDGLQARRTAEQKLLTGVHNYHVPKPVLGQRKFANPSLGAVGFSSARRDGTDAPFQTVESGMTGGVVTTMEGQQFYKKQLADRINQLNRLNSLAQGFAVEMGQDVKSFDNEKIGDENKVRFFALFNELLESVSSDIRRVDFSKIVVVLEDLFKFAPTATREDLNDILQKLEDALPPLRAFTSQSMLYPEDVDESYRSEIFVLTTTYLESMFEYVRFMIRGVYEDTSNRKALSKSLIKQIFGDLRKEKNYRSALLKLANRNPIVRDDVENFDSVWGADGQIGNDGRFSRPAEAREDGEQSGIPRAPFAGRNDDPNRQRHGQRSGLIIFGGPSYFGEAEARDEQVDLVAPLAYAGVDPNAEGDIYPTPDPITLKEAVEAEVKIVLEPLGFVEGGEQTVEQVLEANYGGDYSRFVREVVDGLTEKGFSPSQIAKGMEQLDIDAFGEYVAENTGPTGPARIEPARRNPLVVTTAAPSGDDRRERFFQSVGFPRTREELRRNFKSYESLMRLGARIPEEFGGPYIPRSSTAVKNIAGRLIQIVRSNVDPNY